MAPIPGALPPLPLTAHGQTVSTGLLPHVPWCQVLKRGEGLDNIGQMSDDLKREASGFKWGAQKVSLMVQWQQYAPFVAVGGVLLLIVILRIYF